MNKRIIQRRKANIQSNAVKPSVKFPNNFQLEKHNVAARADL